MGPFYRWSSTASRLQEPLRGGSLIFTTKFPEIPYIYIHIYIYIYIYTLILSTSEG